MPPALTGVRDAIVATGNARTALNWLRTGAGAPLLAALGAGQVPLSHAGLDAEPAGRAVEYLRALLVAHGALPARDEALARLERQVTQLLTGIADREDRRTITAYATWRVLHRARRRAAQRPATTTATQHATASLRAAITLLGWLAGRGIRLAEIHQSDIDRWLLDGPANESGTNRGRLRGLVLPGGVGEAGVPASVVVGEGVVEDAGADLK